MLALGGNSGAGVGLVDGAKECHMGTPVPLPIAQIPLDLIGTERTRRETVRLRRSIN